MTAVTMRVQRPLPPVPDQPVAPGKPEVMLGIMAAFYLGFAIWGIVSGVGLLRLRNWARLCFAVFGSILSFGSLCGVFGVVISAWMLPQLPQMQANVPSGLIRTILAVFGFIALLSATLGIWWVIYFNRADVKTRFLGETVQPARQFPFSITLISWFLIIGGTAMLAGLFWGYPAVVFGFVVHGWAGHMVDFLYGAVGLASGIGMLRKHVVAHSLAMGYFAFGLLNTLCFFVIPGAEARMRSLFRELGGGQPDPINVTEKLTTYSTLFGAAITILLLLLLMRSRRAFIEGCSATPSQGA